MIIIRESGIYRFYNVINGKSYIGQSNNLRHRYTEHLSLLRRGVEPCPLLSKAWEKYGEENIKYEVLCYCDEDKLNEMEQYYIDKYDSLRNGYNCTAGGDGISGFHHTDEAKKKISAANVGKTISDEQRKKISDAQKGRPLAKEHCEALSKAWTDERKQAFIKSRSGPLNPNYGKTGRNAITSTPVICSTGEFFFTTREAAEWCGLKTLTGNIPAACSDGKKHAGKHPITGERLSWRRATKEEIEIHKAQA